MRPTHVASALLLALLVAACSYTAPELAPVVPANAESSVVVDESGRVLFTFHGVENRESVPLSAVPAHVVDAVVAIEDHRYWEHRGVDVRALFRALRANVSEGEVVEGGSTITQQYVKNALDDRESSLDRKVREAITAYQLEQRYSKEEILERYLNTVYFGSGAYGIQAAAQEHFGKDVGDLDLAEGALLAGVIQAPSTFDPGLDADAAVERRNVVIDRMAELDMISAADALEASSEVVTLRPAEAADRYEAPYFVEEVRRFILEDPVFGETPEERRDLLFEGGLTIQTSLDPGIQAAAELAVERVLADPANDPSAAVVVIDPATGWVRALVGGRDFFGDEPTAKFNLATQGRRPTGSAFKPLVLTAALEEGFSLEDTYEAPAHIELPVTGGTWEVDNYDNVAGGQVDLREATVWSYNTAYAQLVLDVGPDDATRMAARLGITTPLLPVPSAVLGSNDISPLDLTSAYATLAADGMRRTPAFVTRVEAADGSVLYRWEDEGVVAVDSEIARTVTGVLEHVVGRGTGVNALIGRPVAGKTGTGQNWGDAWFVGYTPDLVAGVWVGFPEGQVSMRPPTTRETVTGGGWPAQIWQLLMFDALAESPIVDFPESAAPGDDGDPTTAGPVGDLMPRLIGLPEGPAIDAVTRLGLVAEPVYVPDDQFPSGIVVGHAPAHNEPQPESGVVVLEVANGQPVPRAPDVFGEPAPAAEATLSALGIEVVVHTEPEDDPESAELHPGEVWMMNPAPGAPLGPDRVVEIWVNP